MTTTTTEMTPAVLEAVETKLKKAIFKMIFAYRFLGNLSLGLRRVASPSITTLCTDARTFFYSPEFVHSLPFPRLVAAIAHEIFHAALGHCNPYRVGRREVMVRMANGIVTSLWNIAADYVVNAIIAQTIDQWIRDNPGKKPFMELDPGWLHDTRYYDMSVEAVYNDLLQRIQSYPKGEDGIPEAKDIRGDQFDDHMSNTALKAQVSDTQARMLSDQWKLRLDKEIAAIKMSGSAIPGFLKQLSSIMHVEEKVDWRSQFESYAMDIYKTVYRMNPPNKRSYHLGVIMPSIRGEHIEVAVVVDTSYSQLAYIKKIYAELQHIFAAFDSYKIVVIECDSQVNAVYEYNTGEDFGDLQPEAAGGGGTDFRPAFEYVEQNHPETNLMVFATDGYGSFPTEEPPYNVIWLTAPNTLPISCYPFGTAIVVDDLMETEET